MLVSVVCVNVVLIVCMMMDVLVFVVVVLG